MRTFTAPKTTWDGIKRLEEGNRDRWFASLPLQQIGQSEEVAERLMCWDPTAIRSADWERVWEPFASQIP
jgi:hypothetical protein